MGLYVKGFLFQEKVYYQMGFYGSNYKWVIVRNEVVSQKFEV